jgi:hypothetical protein
LQAQLGGRSLKAFQFVSVCSVFKRQLGELMALLNQLEPHYVRCIKPNPASKPCLLDDAYALHQLKCGGVMEAVRISCAGEASGREGGGLRAGMVLQAVAWCGVGCAHGCAEVPFDVQHPCI